MESLKRIRFIFHNFLRTALIAVGHDFLQKDGFKPNLYTFFLYGLDAFAIACCAYTVIWYDVSTGLNSIGYGAINVQVKTYQN